MMTPVSGRRSRLLAVLLFLTLALSPTGPADAATTLPPPGFDPTVLVPEDVHYALGAPNLVPTFDGEMVAIWQHEDEILQQRLDATATPAGAEVVLDEADPSVYFNLFRHPVALPDGSVLLAVQELVDPEAPAAEQEIELTLRRFSDEGVASGRAAVTRTGLFGFDDVALGVDAEGRILVAWTADNQVRARQFGADLEPQTGILPVADLAHAGYLLYAVDLVRLPDGRSLVVWEESLRRPTGDYTSPYPARVLGRALAADGAFAGPAVILVDYGPSFLDPAADWRRHADVEVLPDGTLLMAWSDGGDAGSPARVWARRIAVDGSRVGPDVRVHQDRTYGAVELRVVPDPSPASHRFAILWTSYPLVGDGQTFEQRTYHEVRGRLFLRPGQPVGGEFRLPAEEPWPFSTHLPDAVFAEGSLTVAWRLTSPPRGVSYAPWPPPPLSSFGLQAWTVPLCKPSVPTPHRLCLQGGRFLVEVDAPSLQGPGPVPAHAEPLTHDTGTFWFFRPANLELMVKVLDGTPVNDAFWVFTGALSDVDYTVRVFDHWTRQEEEYDSGGRLVSLVDTTSFHVDDDLGDRVPGLDGEEGDGEVTPTGWQPLAAATGEQIAPSGCDDQRILCFHEGRFQLTLEWEDPRSGDVGPGLGANLTDESGYFWFFTSSNAEVFVKVLDGTPVNGYHWVFVGGLTDVAFTLTVFDTVKNQSFVYENPAFTIQSTAHTAALPGA